jgi:hypothetical protein
MARMAIVRPSTAKRRADRKRELHAADIGAITLQI